MIVLRVEAAASLVAVGAAAFAGYKVYRHVHPEPDPATATADPPSPPPTSPVPITDPVRIDGPLATTPKALADVVYLAPSAQVPGQSIPPLSGLRRELARRALWAAAHDECGLRVPDGASGDPVPGQLPTDCHLGFRATFVTNPGRYAVSVGTGPTP